MSRCCLFLSVYLRSADGSVNDSKNIESGSHFGAAAAEIGDTQDYQHTGATFHFNTRETDPIRG